VTEAAPDTWAATACEGISPGGNPDAHTQVQWCQAWGLNLCADCRVRRNTDELKDHPSPSVRPLSAEPLMVL
jgi:hypothetical protein